MSPCSSVLVRYLVVSVLLAIAGCNGGKSLQNTLAPDPQITTPVAVGTKVSETSANTADFPPYPQAKLQSTAQTKERGQVTTWTTPDPIDFVYAFYQKELAAQQWQIVTQPSDGESQLVATKQQMSVSISPQSGTDKQQAGVTVYTISLLATTAAPTPTPTAVVNNATPTPSASPRTKSSGILPTTTTEYLTDLTQIGVFTSADTQGSDKTPATTRIVTRREYARWLVAAHNRINSTKPTQQLKLANTDAKPTFQDVPSTHPDFPSIQGLAEAGLIPSSLSGDTTTVLFRPDLPLTREQMVLWKIPLDTRQALPAASLDAVKQTWGFQDAGKIDPKALRAILADFQSGEQSNIRRVFGYTTLFQPKKTVNLGEVAIAIWYFGANSEGLSARDAH